MTDSELLEWVEAYCDKRIAEAKEKGLRFQPQGSNNLYDYWNGASATAEIIKMYIGDERRMHPRKVKVE